MPDQTLTHDRADADRAPVITNVQANAGDILGRFADADDPKRAAFNDLSTKAYDRHMTLTAFLEEMDPSSRYNDGLDAYERQLAIAGIRLQSDEQRGIYADTVSRFYESNQPASPILFPEFINRQVRVPLLAPAILDELIAVTTPVDSSSYRSIYLADTTTGRRMSRVTEAAELPRLKVTTSEKAVNLYKYGAMLEGSYEVYRRMRIDMFSLHLARIGLQAQLDKASDALDVAINGDGNANAATNYNLTALDAGTTAGNLTYKAWLRWALKMWPYQLNVVVAGEAELLSILTLQFPNINPLMLLSMLTAGQPVDAKVEIAQNLWTTIRLVFLASAPSNVLVGLNKGSALEMVTEIGSDITETDRIIERQVNRIAITETVGFAVMMTQGIQTLTLNA